MPYVQEVEGFFDVLRVWQPEIVQSTSATDFRQHHHCANQHPRAAVSIFNKDGWEPNGLLPKHHSGWQETISPAQMVCWVPHLGGKSSTLQTAHERFGKMGTLGKAGSAKIEF